MTTMAMNETDYTAMLEYAFRDEGKAVEFYGQFLDMLPRGKDFDKVRVILKHIEQEEINHLHTLAQLIDDLEA
jgi:rubrerythrin